MALVGRLAGRSCGIGSICRALSSAGAGSKVGSICRALSSAGAGSKVALILSGCGVYDGSEIHEASACLVHLSRHGAQVAVFAPDAPQMHVVNHITGQPAEPTESRNVLVESARIARGAISPLSALDVGQFSAVVFPGGFGAAKHLSNYAVEGEGMEVEGEAKRVLQQFRAAEKPIGLCCISPVLAARLFPGVAVTIGNDTDPAATAISGMGATHVPKHVTEVCVDSDQMVVTTPAFMCEAPLHQIFDGIGEMISSVLKLVK